jgi:hypothetical protein
MRNRNVSALLTLGVAAVFLLAAVPAAEAELICKRFRPSGPKVCWEARTSSVEFIAIAQGVAAKLAKDCTGVTGDDNCHIEIIASVYGTIQPRGRHDPDYEECGVDSNSEFDGFPEGKDACLIIGEGECTNPGINNYFNENGTAFVPGPLTNFSKAFTCDSGGTCYEEVTVSAQGFNGICPNRHWTLVDFTPREFFGELAFCPGGFLDDLVQYSSGQWGPTCCTSDKRTESAGGGEIMCFKPYQEGQPTEGEPGFIRTFCQYPNQGPIEKGVNYVCDDI